ncbi:peroxisomal leader peptide-processing protease [Lampris incognitus]|uniref:peroxisomal leader peptide-processing protease n=1 Tax=Lampris incognitus TaxID=2546036 RepID=UPI0024B602CC|nr:peroxisomal leader peptide-processing protease [Lampris incognitus]
MDVIERTCCVVTVSDPLSDRRPGSCSGVILNEPAGMVICSGLLFSRFFDGKETFSTDHGFLLPHSSTEKVNIHVHLSEHRDLDINQCAYEASTVHRGSATYHHKATAELMLLVNCLEFRRAFKSIFREADKWHFHGSEEDEELVRDSHLLSWFAVLKSSLVDGAPDSGTVPWLKSSSLQKGCSVIACGSPFGSLYLDLFSSALSKGIISNLAGEDNAVIFTDARCLPGTEGGGLFLQNGNRVHLVGLIVSPLCWKANEWIGLTLVCSVQLIVKHIMCSVKVQHPLKEIHFHKGASDLLNTTLTSENDKYPTVCLIDSGQFWGSGVVVSPQLALTCRHVISGKSFVTLRFSHRNRFTDVVGDVLFTTKASSPYDLALVKLRHPAPEVVVPRLAETVQPGEDVVVVGYGALGRSCGPSMTCGILSKVISWNYRPVMLQTTCAVQAGASGGAVVRARSGELLGIVSSNTRDFATQVTYPHLNFSIPVTVFQPLLHRFNQTRDVEVFRALDATEEEVLRVWRLQGAQSKL